MATKAKKPVQYPTNAAEAVKHAKKEYGWGWALDAPASGLSFWKDTETWLKTLDPNTTMRDIADICETHRAEAEQLPGNQGVGIALMWEWRRDWILKCLERATKQGRWAE